MYELPGETDITEVVVTEQVVRAGAEPTRVRGPVRKAAGAARSAVTGGANPIDPTTAHTGGRRCFSC
jgi:hypothetical protein